MEVEGGATAPGLAVRLAANTLVQAVGSVLGSLVSFFTFVAVTRGLGPAAFGDLTTATVFLYVPVVLAELGFTATVVREISREPERTEEAMRASVPLRLIVAAGGIGAAVGLGMAMPFNDRTKVAILISSLGAFLTLATVSVLPVLQAQLKMHWAVVGNLAGRLLTLALTLGALAAGLGFKSIVAAQVVGIALTFVVYVAVVATMVPLRPRIDLRYWRALLGTSIVLGLALAVSQVYFRLDTVLIALIRSPEEVGLYGAAYKFIELSELLIAAAGVSLVPPLARFIATGDPRAGPLVQRVFDVLVAAAAPLAVAMLILPREIVVATAGEDFSDAAGALRLLGPYVLLSFASGVFWRVLLAAGRDRALLAMSTSVLSLNLALNLVLLPRYGFKAAAVTSVVSELFALALATVVVRRQGLLPGVRYLPVVAVAAAAMAGTIALLPGPALIAAAVGSIVYLALLLAAPGAAREIVFADLLPALIRLRERRASGGSK